MVVMALVAAACTGGRGDDDAAPPGDDTVEPDEPEPLASGALELVAGSNTCTPGTDRCESFEVSCPGLSAAAAGEVAIDRAPGAERGVVVLFSGAWGSSWFDSRPRMMGTLLEDFGTAGLTVVQVRWRGVGKSWQEAAPGDTAGGAAVGCRPATVLRWVYDEIYAPLDVERVTGVCGFCAMGSSAGASQIAYALAFYGADALLDVAVPIVGPPHADLAKACRNEPGEDEFWFSDANMSRIDAMYGVPRDELGPCAQHDRTYLDRWTADGVATGGLDHLHPDTAIHFVLGDLDDSGALAQAREYERRLRDAGSPDVTVHLIEGMGHRLNEDGYAAAAAVLTGNGTRTGAEG